METDRVRWSFHYCPVRVGSLVLNSEENPVFPGESTARGIVYRIDAIPYHRQYLNYDIAIDSIVKIWWDHATPSTHFMSSVCEFVCCGEWIIEVF